MGSIQNELNDFLYKPAGNHVLANECDSGTNYLRYPRYHRTSSSTTRNTRKILNTFNADVASTCTFTVKNPRNTGHLLQRNITQQGSTATEETTGMRDTAHLNVFVRGRNVVLQTTGELSA